LADHEYKLWFSLDAKRYFLTAIYELMPIKVTWIIFF